MKNYVSMGVVHDLDTQSVSQRENVPWYTFL